MALTNDLISKTINDNSKLIALAGNPNVGKSTIFNALTGLNQHTGNWPGKTVSSAIGVYKYNNNTYTLIDLPGTYSLLPNSKEEEVARDFICFDKHNLTIVVIDATALERNLNLALQVIEANNNVLVCVNLMDEAKKKEITIDLKKLSKILKVPVIGTCATSKRNLSMLIKEIENKSNIFIQNKKPILQYSNYIENVINKMIIILNKYVNDNYNKRFLAIKL
ncbi:MAG: FeoB small GTPase domain-containing protein, partial [Bacilli bacterium]